MKEAKRIFSIFLCILFISISMLSILFVATHTDHNCVGDGCATCMHLQQAASFIKRAEGGGTSHFIVQFTFLITALLVCAAIRSSAISLVSQKTRMNN